MAGIIVHGGKIIRVETDLTRPAWIEDATSLNKEKQEANKGRGEKSNLEMCHKLAYALICKYIRRALKGLTLEEAANWFNNSDNWVDKLKMPRRIDKRWQKQMPLRMDEEIAPNTANIGELVDEWLKNANSYLGNLWLADAEINNAKAQFLKQAMGFCRNLALGPKLYHYNQLRVAVIDDIVGKGTDDQPCDMLWRCYTWPENGSPVLQEEQHCRSIGKDLLNRWFLTGDYQMVFITTNLPTQKVFLRLEAFGVLQEGAILCLKNQIYKVSRSYDPVESFDFLVGGRTFKIGETPICDFTSLKDCLLFGSLHLDDAKGEQLDEVMAPLLKKVLETSSLGWVMKEQSLPKRL